MHRLWGTALAAMLAGCGVGAEVKLCGRIPADGCPLGRGGTCEDKLCAALYDCAFGDWTLVTTCDPRDAGSDAAAGAEDAASDGPCDLVMLDHTGEVSGCEPDLQSPDCPAVAAETCAQTACLTECTDFFLCTAPGWTLVAHCDDQGHLVIGP